MDETERSEAVSETDAATPSRARDRRGTEAAIVEAARALLVETGFQALGVNAIARRAGCDKQLIYRYFDGLDGVVEALGTDIAERLARALPKASDPPRSYEDLIVRLAMGLVAALRADALLRRVIVWEMAEPSPLVERFAAARSRAISAWMTAQRGTLTAPDLVDGPAANAVLIAAIQHLVVAGAEHGRFAGLELSQEADWDRLSATLGHLVRALYRRD